MRERRITQHLGPKYASNCLKSGSNTDTRDISQINVVEEGPDEIVWET